VPARSFTGLRIACAVTQGLAFGADLPVLGVSTLASLAEQTGFERVLAVLDARMAEVYWAAFERAASGWLALTEPALALPGSVFVPDERGWGGAGNGLALLDPALCDTLIASETGLMPDAAAIAAIAAPMLARGEGVDAALAAPIYLRDKVAMTSEERRLKKLAQTA
jgi:Inactive homolog of metal-dependent proteases, putative molecular chaperone